MVIWLIERPDRASQAACIDWLLERLRQGGQLGSNGKPVPVECRVLPANRLWAQCVELVKNKDYPKQDYPVLIEYPLIWQESLDSLGLLARLEDVETQDQRRRWKQLQEHVYESNFSLEGIPSSSGDIFTFPWLVGLTMLFYRRDLLRAMEKTPEDLESFSSWSQILRDTATMGRYWPLEMPLHFPGALWWILSFNGAFLDNLNLMPAFHQAEALGGLEAMLESLVPLGKSSGGMAMRSFSLGMGLQRHERFPEKSFCLLSNTLPASLCQGDPRVGITLPPKVGNSKAVVAQEYALGVTRAGLRSSPQGSFDLLEFFLGDTQNWLGAASRLGMLPARTLLWENFFDALSDPLIKEVYYAAVPSIRWIPRSKFLAPTIQIFEDCLTRLYLQALREGRIDSVRIAAYMSQAAAEYRLMVALYGNAKGLFAGRNSKEKAASYAADIGS